METNNLQSSNGFKTRCGPSYNKGWNIMFTFFIELVVVSLVYFVIQMPTNMVQVKANEWHWIFIPMVIFGIAYGIFIAGPIGYSTGWVFLKAVRGEKIEIKDMFSVFERNYWNAVLASIIVGVIVAFGFIMLIVPGIIFAVRLAFVKYLIIDRKMEALEALKTSWNMTRGHGWHIFWMGLLVVPIILAGIIMLFVGVFISAMWISAAFAVMYHAVCLKRGEFLVPIEQEQV
jgi:hypothetical protein